MVAAISAKRLLQPSMAIYEEDGATRSHEISIVRIQTRCRVLDHPWHVPRGTRHPLPAAEHDCATCLGVGADNRYGGAGRQRVRQGLRPLGLTRLQIPLLSDISCATSYLSPPIAIATGIQIGGR